VGKRRRCRKEWSIEFRFGIGSLLFESPSLRLGVGRFRRRGGRVWRILEARSSGNDAGGGGAMLRDNLRELLRRERK